MAADDIVRAHFVDVTFNCVGCRRILAHPSPGAKVRVERGSAYDGIVIRHGDIDGDGVSIHLTFAQAAALAEQLQEAQADG